MYRSGGKRLLDLVLVVPGILFMLPVMGIIAGVIRWKLGSPVLFKQRRPGWNGKPFIMLKFRTMTEERNHEGALLSDGKRLTALGRFLRASSLDELPELLNVLRGEMSLVGPRPLLMEYLPLYTRKQARRHDVRPGLTGWAQVNGRNTLTWEDKFEYDVWYVDHSSFMLDLKIMMLTLVKIIKREGISAEGHSTMSRFER